MGFEENIYRYLGLGVVILVALYILIKTLTFQGKIIEGLTNSTTETTSDPTTSAEISLLNTVTSKSTEGITAQNNKLQDILALDKYRTDYENLIIALEDYVNVMMFAKVVSHQHLDAKNELDFLPEFAWKCSEFRLLVYLKIVNQYLLLYSQA